MDKSKSLKFCVIFLTICAVTVGPIHMFKNNLAMGILLVAMIAVVDVVYFMLKDKDKQRELSYVVCLAAVATIATTQIVSGASALQFRC